MNPTDYYELQLLIIGVLNENFEFWLGATFGVIVAFHFAAKTISIGLLRITVFLYVGTSLMFGYRFANALSGFAHFNEVLIAAGYEPYPALPNVASVIGGVTAVVMLVGTTSTVMYVYRCYKESVESNA